MCLKLLDALGGENGSLCLYGWVVGKFISPLGFIWLRYLVYRFDNVLSFIGWYLK